MKNFKNIKTGEIKDWNTMILDFTSETTGGELTDEEINDATNEQFIKMIEAFTDFR